MLLRAVFRNTVMNISLCNALLCREPTACGLSGRPIIGRRQGWRPRHPPRVSRRGICRSSNAPSLLCVRELRGLREYRKQLFVGGISRCNLHGRMSRLLGLYATSCFPLGRSLLLYRGATALLCQQTCFDWGYRSRSKLVPSLWKIGGAVLLV